ncbi:DNA-binding winged helix-turn-helix (wHTH) domain-containing protein [Candidatus Pantoea varia]|uniref:DNA-binding winged helix-turn-helix (WHTH) domain-containing protein n=1 Tax=Candidatus Pantoea varia TaxID=1881036 RepID=A0A1I5HU62_9GAMM|nr:winged helix-turn-helix domain-containing protein [Pantoea varia]SFO51878.1 DNA-binding winged helix-turn-helix (wHTH) domain-containing protein [Pantoea varia]
MHNYYIINGFIEFHPAASTLSNLNDPEKVVVLNSPASRCLLLLLQKSNEIVTQHEFMKTVWEKNGMLITPNTFYQNISLLRKGLKKVGMLEDPIMTIPRVGLTLASGTLIKKRSSEKLADISQEHPFLIDEYSKTQEAPEHDSLIRQPEVEEVEPKAAIPVAGITAEPMINQPQEVLIPRKSFSLYLWVMGLVAMFSLVVIVSLTNSGCNIRHYFSDYHFLANTSGCHIFIADKNATPDDKIRMMSLVSQFKISCSDYPWVYITHYVMLPRISVVRCNKQMSEQNICISEYYFRGLK